MSCKDKNNSCTRDVDRGCVFCNCETEATATICDGCFKLHATDWLEGMPNSYNEEIVEVRFKNTRRSYYLNVNGLPLRKGDIVAVEASPGHDIGIVSLTGDIVARQMRRIGFSPHNGEFKKIYRKARPYDIERWQEAISLEHDTMIRSRQIAEEMGLDMKIGDVEYQGDRIKAIFYYIADERVDFRELIRVFAEQFRIRVEMRQIGARQEAGRIGGIGSCGRELCCSSWIANFVSVTTNSARTQEISLNPQKLAGQCSKLKCCLVYELDNYIDARKEFPKVNAPLQAMDGEYYLVKSDILARTMSFSTTPNAMIGVRTLPIERVKEILAINKKGQKADMLEGVYSAQVEAKSPDFVDVIGEDSITRFDQEEEKKTAQPRRRSRRARGSRRGRQARGAQAQNQQQQQGKQDQPQDQKKEQQTSSGQGQDEQSRQRAGGDNKQRPSGRRRGRGRRGGNQQARSNQPNQKQQERKDGDSAQGAEQGRPKRANQRRVGNQNKGRQQRRPNKPKDGGQKQ